MTYYLGNGYKVTTRKVDTGTEFETRNARNETISTVVLDFIEARQMVLSLAKLAV